MISKKTYTHRHARAEKLGRIEITDTSKLNQEEILMLRELFSQIDVDGSNSLSASELLQFGDQLGLSKVQVMQMLAEGDDDGDGEIDFEEFCLLMRHDDKPDAPWRQIKRLHRHRFSNDPLSYVRLANTDGTGPGNYAPKIAQLEVELLEIVSRKPTSVYVNQDEEDTTVQRVLDLLQQGARPNCRNPTGQTSIHLAVQNCHTKIVGALVRHHSADLDLVDAKTGCTALHYAVRNIELEILLAYGADRWKKNYANASPGEELAVRLVNALHSRKSSSSSSITSFTSSASTASPDQIMKKTTNNNHKRSHDANAEAEHISNMLNTLSRTQLGGSKLPGPRGGSTFPGAVCIHYKWPAPYDGLVAKVKLQMGWSEADHSWNTTPSGEQYVGVGIFDLDEGKGKSMLVAVSRAIVNPNSVSVQDIKLEAPLKIQSGQYVGVFMPRHLQITKIPVAFHDAGEFQHTYCYMTTVPDLYGSSAFHMCKGHVGMQTWIEYPSIVDLLMVSCASTTNLLDLVERGGNVNATYDAVLGGRTPLSVAAMSGDFELVRSFLEFPNIDTALSDRDGQTALHLACKGASFVAHAQTLGGDGSGGASRTIYQDICRALVLGTRSTEKRNVLINLQTVEGKTPLHEAATTIMASENRSTVHFVRTVNIDVVLALLEAGADVAIVDNEGDSPLHLVCRNSHSPSESQMGDGAGPDRWTEHEYLVRLTLRALIEYYIESPANQNGKLALFATQNARGNTPLMEAVTCLCADVHKGKHHRAAIFMLLEYSRSGKHGTKGQSIGLSCVNTFGENAFSIAASNQDLLTACLIASGGGFKVDEATVAHIQNQHDEGRHVLDATLLVSDAQSARASLCDLCDMGIDPCVYIDSATGKRLAPPTIEVEEHNDSVIVSMRHDERGVRIMWTMDGSTPTADQRYRHEYSRPFMWTCPGTYCLKAAAFVQRSHATAGALGRTNEGGEVLSSESVQVEFVIKTSCGFGCGERLHMHERRTHENKYCTRWSIVQKKLGLNFHHGNNDGGGGGGRSGNGVRNEENENQLSHLHPGRKRSPKRKSVEEIEVEERKRYEEEMSGRKNEHIGSSSSSSKSSSAQSNTPRQLKRSGSARSALTHSLARSPSRDTPHASPYRKPTESFERVKSIGRKASTTVRMTSSPSMTIHRTMNRVTPLVRHLGEGHTDEYDKGNSPMLEPLDDNADPAVQEYMDGLVESIASNTSQGQTLPPLQQQRFGDQTASLSPLKHNRFIQFLLQLEIDPLDAVAYQQKLNHEGFSSVASIRCSKLKRQDLIELGIKRGHAALIVYELKQLARKEKEKKEDAARLFNQSTRVKSNNSPHRKSPHKNVDASGESSGILDYSIPGMDQDSFMDITLRDPKRIDTMSSAALCTWLDAISLGQYKSMVRRLHLNGARLLSMTETDLKKVISNRFHRQHLKNAAQSSQLEHKSLSNLMHNSNEQHGHMSMCLCEACSFATKQKKPKQKKANVQKTFE